MQKSAYQILLCNDDGIDSPGLWAAAHELSALGWVTIAAPRDQASSTGRSLPLSSDGQITRRRLQIGADEWEAYAVGGSPAQTVQHAVLEIMPQPPDLVVVGINYGENPGSSITISGTVGAALEAAAMGIPALAVSLQLLNEDYYGYSRSVDFSTAAIFTRRFAQQILEQGLPRGVDLFKLEVPADATPETDWRMTRLSQRRYYVPFVKQPGRKWEENAPMGFKIETEREQLELDSDTYTLVHDHLVSLTPLTLDSTAQVNRSTLESEWKARKG